MALSETFKSSIRSINGKRRLRRSRRWLFPINIEKEYQRELVSITNKLADAVRLILIPAIPSIVEEGKVFTPESARQDGFVESITNRIESLVNAYSLATGNINFLTQGVALKLSDFNRTQFQRSIKSITKVDVFPQNEPWLNDQVKAFTAENVGLIKNIGDKAIEDISGLMQREVRAGTRAETITALVESRLSVAKSRAKLIARDQVNKLNGDLSRLRQTELGVERYIWHTVGDDRVRLTHRAKNARTYSWNKPPADTGHPGHDIQCRCWAEPILTELL